MHSFCPSLTAPAGQYSTHLPHATQFSLVTFANEGSHRQTIDKAVKDGVAPFLVSSTIFELMNVLMWMLQLPSDQESKDKVDSIVANLALELSLKTTKMR